MERSPATSQEPWGRTGCPAQVRPESGQLLASAVILPAEDPAQGRLPPWLRPLDRPGLAWGLLAVQVLSWPEAHGVQPRLPHRGHPDIEQGVGAG